MIPDSGWSVHVAGADDVIPVGGRIAAMKEAHAINAATIAYAERVARETPDSFDYLPTVWARPLAPGEKA